MKCPITPNPAAAALIKQHDLVYVGMGSKSAPLFKEKGIPSLCVATRGKQDAELYGNEGFIEDAYYFVSRKNAAKYFPEVKPVPKPARKVSPKPSNHIVPEGYVYLGKGGEFKTVGSKFFGFYLWGESSFGGRKPETWEMPREGKYVGLGYYYAPIDSYIARLNGLGAKTKRLSATALLKKEIETLKVELAASKTETAALKSRLAEIEKLAKIS